MTRGRVKSRQADLTRALKGARDAGFEVGRVEIYSEGKIVLFVKSERSEPLSVVEQWKEAHGSRSA